MLLFCHLLVRSDLSVSRKSKIQWQISRNAERMPNSDMEKIKQTKNGLLIKQQVAVLRTY